MNFSISKAELSDYEAIADVIRTAYESLENKDWFVADNAEYVYRTLSEGSGAAYVARCIENGEIAGIFMTAFPGEGEKNLGWDVGFTREQCQRAATMDSAAVLPKYGGNHLQYRLMQAAEAELRALGYRYLLCTVHPDNHRSRNTVLRQGYRVMKTTEKYGGYIRDILMKEL